MNRLHEVRILWRARASRRECSLAANPILPNKRRMPNAKVPKKIQNGSISTTMILSTAVSSGAAVKRSFRIQRQQQNMVVRWCCLFLLLSSTAHAFITAAPRSSVATVSRHTITRLHASFATSSSSVLCIGEEIGRGSYGIVHLCTLGDETLIGKRAFVLDELEEQQDSSPQDRLKRCQYYLNVERHCFEKLSSHPQIPNYRGVVVDKDGNDWMTFDMITSSSRNHHDKVAPTLQQVMEDDWKVQHEGQEHHLFKLQQALGLSTATATDDSSFAQTLDCVMESLLQVLSHVHSQGHIVHRDVKPANLLVDSKHHALVLIDFGSAADMDPIPRKSFFGGTTRVGLEDDNRVAVSPVYSAPELFIQHDRCVRTVLLLRYSL